MASDNTPMPPALNETPASSSVAEQPSTNDENSPPLATENSTSNRRQFEVLPPSRSSTATTPATDGDGLLPPPPRLLQHYQRLVPPVPTAPLPGPRAIGVVGDATDGETFASSRLPFRDRGRQTSSTATTTAADGGNVTILPPRGPNNQQGNNDTSSNKKTPAKRINAAEKKRLRDYFISVNWPLNKNLPRGEKIKEGELGKIVTELKLSKGQVTTQLRNYKDERYGNTQVKLILDADELEWMIWFNLQRG